MRPIYVSQNQTGNNYLRKERQFRKKLLRKDRRRNQNRVYMISKKYLGKTKGVLLMYWRKKIREKHKWMDNEKDPGVR